MTYCIRMVLRFNFYYKYILLSIIIASKLFFFNSKPISFSSFKIWRAAIDKNNQHNPKMYLKDSPTNLRF